MKKVSVLAVLFVIAANLVACDRVKRAATTAGKALIDCGKEDLARVVREDGTTLLSAAITVLQAQGEGWRDALATLGDSVGESALACAVEAVRVGANAARFQIAPVDVAARASTYVEERGWRFAE